MRPVIMHVYNVKRMNRYAIYGRPLILWGGGQFHILHRPAIIWKLRNFCPVFSDNFGWTIKPTLFIPIKMYTKDPTKTTCSFSSIFLTRLFSEYLSSIHFPLATRNQPGACVRLVSNISLFWLWRPVCVCVWVRPCQASASHCVWALLSRSQFPPKVGTKSLQTTTTQRLSWAGSTLGILIAWTDKA